MSFDDITVDQLRIVGGSKWTRFPGTLGAFIAEMDFGMAPPIADRLHRMIDLGQVGYLAPAWISDLQQATASFVGRRYGWDLAPEQVIAIPDVLVGLEVAMDHYLPADARVVLPTPAYMPFLTLPGVHHRELVQVPMLRTEDSWDLDWEGLDAVFRPGDLFILCNPHNPIGKTYSRQDLVRIAAFVADRGGRVFNDEIHAPLVLPGAGHINFPTVSPDAARVAITAMSASKSWNLAGLKCAQLVLTNPEDLAQVARFAPHEPSTAGVFANTVAYNEGEPWLAEVLAYLDGNRAMITERVAQELPGVRYLPPEATFLAWLDLPDSGLDDRVSAFFRTAARVAMTPGRACGAAGRTAVRLNFGCPRPILDQMLTRLGRAYRER